MRVASELSVCGNCLCIVANGDWTGCADEAEEARIREALDEIGTHLVPSCDENCEGEFTWTPCDLCGATGREDHFLAILEES